MFKLAGLHFTMLAGSHFILTIILSAPRCLNDMDPEHPGLRIVVGDSFNEIVLDRDKHVFLDVSADWCGPSVQMKPEWHALANLLKDSEHIIVAYMDGKHKRTCKI